MDPASVRELKQSLGPTPERYQLRVQLETLREKTTKTGNPYYQLEFSDGEETLVLRVWNNSPMFPTCGQLLEHGFYELSGDFALGSDGRSIDSHEWQVRGLNEAETEAVLSGSARLREKQALDFDFIERSVKEIADPRLKAVATLFLDRFGERLRRTAAARDYHHARRGGLVEHVSQMMRTAIQICEAYPNLNRDLLVCGVLFHDVGKLWENAYVPQGFTMPYTEVSELLGHIPMGMEVVNRLWREAEEAAKEDRWRDLEPSADRVRLHLLHLIVSHHGELAFGSPVVPKTPEAQALHYIDNLDAKMEMFERGYEVATELAPRVMDRVRPLPGKLVEPLPQFVQESDLPLVEENDDTSPEAKQQDHEQDPSDPHPGSERVHHGADEENNVEETPIDDGLPIALPSEEELREGEPF